MPENEEKSQDRQTAARKKPEAAGKAGDAVMQKGAKSADREARLAEALRANLRRRKAKRRGAADEKDT